MKARTGIHYTSSHSSLRTIRQEKTGPFRGNKGPKTPHSDMREKHRFTEGSWLHKRAASRWKGKSRGRKMEKTSPSFKWSPICQKACIMFSCNPKLIKEIPISSRDISPCASCGASGGKQHWWGGVSVSNSSPGPLLSTGPINASDIGSAQLQSTVGGGACKHQEQGTRGEEGEHGEPGLLLHKDQVLIAPGCWNVGFEANCQLKVRSIEEQLI